MHAKKAISPLLLAAPAVLAQEIGTGSCTDVHIFLARGWNEPYPGRQGTLVKDICTEVSGSCDYEDIAYPAESDDYCPSVLQGNVNGKQQIEAYHARCPDTKLILSGYSEGSNIIGDILTSGSCGSSPGLNPTSGVSCNIAAALLFGDPRHQPYQPYNYLDGTAGQGIAGTRSEASNQILNGYTPRLRSYCSHDDLVCAPGQGTDSVEAHTNYFDIYSQDAASWAVGLLNSFEKGKYCPTFSTPLSTSTTAVISSSPTPYASPSRSNSAKNNTTCTSASPTTTIAGKPAVIISSIKVATTTLWNFPTIAITKATPVATSYIGSVGWSNGTVPTAPAGTGAGSWASSTAKPSVTPYTGAASSVKAVGWAIAGVVGAVGMMMML
ncbi:Acetylxylan esterase [Cercospora zeina]